MTDADLRDRIAAALRDNLKRRTIAPPPDPFHGMIGSIGLTEFDLADVALAVVQPELDQRGEERDQYAEAIEHLSAEYQRVFAFAARHWSEHMRFGVIQPDGSTEMSPCADWCYACKLEQAQQRARLAEIELETLRGGLHEVGADPTQIQNLWAQIRLRNRQWRAAQAERDGTYRERAQLVALLAAIYPSTLAYNDPTTPEWAVVYLDLPTGQASWHVAPADVEFFGHVHRDDSHEWDGHTTAEKYQRIAALVARS